MKTDPYTPHRIALLGDTSEPTEGGIRKAELILILLLLKQNIGLRCWSKHHTFPVSKKKQKQRVFSHLHGLPRFLIITIYIDSGN